MHSLNITGGEVLLGTCATGLSGGTARIFLHLADGLIGPLDEAPPADLTLDADGLLVLPGIVDIHGDAFERQLQPRPNVDFPAAIALRDTEAQLLANGITTAFHGITLSWEPGLRSLDAWRAILDTLAAERWVCDMRVHLRWEAYNLDALDVALADIAGGRVHLLAFNDHTPSILRKLQDPVAGAKYSDRAGMSLDAFTTLAQGIAARQGEVQPALDRIAAAARAAVIPMASHDDATIADRGHFRALGARICEFPMAAEVGDAAREAGEFVVMGSPNVVRGRSHLGWASAAMMAEAGICTVLSSDYYYPAMMRAALKLADRGVLDLPRAWGLIAAAPAAATGLADRGVIASGKRADLIVIDRAANRLIATIARGQLAHLTSAGARRLRTSRGSY